MAPKTAIPTCRSEGMTFKLTGKKRPMATCTHESEMKIEVAGMSRSVCESCGRVSVAYVDSHFTPERVQELTGKSKSAE